MECDYLVADDPYGLELSGMDALEKGDVVVHSTDFAEANAPWGELMSTAAQRRGCVGCICDSQIRDCQQIMEMRFPVFYRGIRPVDSQGRGRVMALDVPVRCGGVLVESGATIVAGFDGVVVVPQEREEAIVEIAARKLEKERLTREELRAGHSLMSVFARHGVL
jgi:regulator of RNase E activity RraA